jgi:plastocyanin
MHWQRTLSLGLVVLCAAVALVSCKSSAGASGGSTLNVTATEFKFDPANVTAKTGQPVTLNLNNKGTVIHDWVVQGMSIPVSVEAQPGKTASVTFTPPTAGTFKVVCTQPAHEQSGMVGQLVVQ